MNGRGVRRSRRAAVGGHVGPRRVWLFDLDHTLHDATRHMKVVDQAMTAFIMQALNLDEPGAHALRQGYARRYGATVSGLRRHHAIDPHQFLRQTHAAAAQPGSVLRDGRLINALRRLPGLKFVLTNAPHAYARRVLRGLGVMPWLDGLIAVEHLCWAGQWLPKPSRPMLRKVLARLRQPAPRCVLVEDSVPNLRAARHCGVRTVWIRGMAASCQPPWCRPRRGHQGIDVQLKRVVELARTSLARPFHEH